MPLSTLRFAIVVAFFVSGVQQAQAIFISPDTAVASSQFDSGGFSAIAANTINGSGLPVGFGSTNSHAAYVSGNHWTTASGTSPTTQFITWGFTTAQTLDTIYIWNHLSTDPPASNTGYDVTLFDLTLFDSLNNVLLSLDNVALLPDTANSQAFLFGPIANVSSVRFDIEAVQSSTNFTGLAEVGFNTTQVPEPSSLVLLAGGAAGLFSFGRRRKQ